ncbi:ABC transporter permease [Methanocella conradii]|uniref:ABC transporter permease n=1 Tax=Methanocella conradii TaxID=1175444 RepID=UPI003184486F
MTMKLRDYIIRRLLLLIPVLIGISFITFVLSHMIGDPAAAWLSEKTAGQEQIVKEIRKAHHLDDPIFIQYYYYFVDLSKLDLGRTGRNEGGRPVADALRDYFPATLELAIIGMILALIIGIPLGILSAIYKDKFIDHIVRLFALMGVSMPVFWLGLILKYWLSFKLNLLPLDGRLPYTVPPPPSVTGMYTIDALLAGQWDTFFIALKHALLPSFCLALITMAIITRMMRSSMLETMTQDFIRTARAKGLSERVVVMKHALRNALTPTTTVAGLSFGGLLSGAVMTETIFAWPGIGRFSVNAIGSTDFASIMGFALLIVVIYVFSNLVVDILYVYLDPRVKYG